jgi:HAD superfamily hydrolase (TIGR01509 family)
MIKAVIFDCFGVLATDKWGAFVDSLPDDADLEAARQAHREYSAGFIDKDEVGARIREATGKDFTEVEDMHESLAKNTGLLAYIAELHQRGLKLGILSNVGSNWIRDTFLTPEEANLFDDFVLSYEVGLLKPDPQMFELAAERLGIETGEAVMVDDKERYCIAATDIGMKAVQFESLAQFKADLEKLLA